MDEDRLVLVGNSYGGLLAARAAAFESRLAAAVLVDGVWDSYTGFSTQLSPETLALYEAGNYTAFDDEVFSLRKAGKLSTTAAWGIDQGLWSFYTHSPSEFFTKSKQFELASVASKINMPIFVSDAEYEPVWIGQPKQVKDSIG